MRLGPITHCLASFPCTSVVEPIVTNTQAQFALNCRLYLISAVQFGSTSTEAILIGTTFF